MKNCKIIFMVVFTVLIMMFTTSCISFTDEIITSENVTRISYIDVGQGDCTLVELENGEVMLIDAGESEYGDDVAQYLREKQIRAIDYLIATHPHNDHIGAISYIMDNFEIGTFYMPDVTNNTRAFEKLLVAIEEHNINAKLAKAGDVIFDKYPFKACVLSPVKSNYDEINDYSIVIKLECNEKSFLFMGDAEKYAENLITGDVKCDVLKVGHHGSTTSTGKKFLEKADPDYAIISCGFDNSYGHPHDEIIERLENKNIEIHRTDTEGTVVLICDGENINVEE